MITARKLLFYSITFCSLILMAAPTAQFNSASKGSAAVSSLSLATGIEYSEKIAREETSNQSEKNLEVLVNPSYKLSDNFKISLKAVITKSNKGSKDAEISDTNLSLGLKGLEISPTIKTVHSASYVIPTSVDSREQDRLMGAVSLSNGLSYAGPIFEFTYTLGLIELVHQYNMNAEGSPNMQHLVSNILSVQINLLEKVNFSASGVHTWGQTYGRKQRTVFEVSADINYELQNKMTLNFGTSNAGPVYNADGVKSNFSAFSANSSILRAGLSILL